MTAGQVFEELGVGDGGLRDDEAQRRLLEFGPNELPRGRVASKWLIFLRQFRNPLIYILGVAALLSLATERASDALFIVGVLCLNATIGAMQEWKAEQSAQALRKLLRIRATVLRDGAATEADAEQLVPGDIVLLESGNRVPADVRLVETRGLESDESLLTGESLPVGKDSGVEHPEGTVVSERSNMAFAGSIVVRGRGTGLVVETGTSTVVGRLAHDVMGEKAVKPPLVVRMERFARTVGIVIVCAAVLIAVLGIFVRGQDVAETLLFAIALVVAAIPEGLPVAMTVALAIAVTRMSKRGVIVRRLAAVEGLGSCTYIASDKTGTLTVNELTVREVSLSGGEHLSFSEGDGKTEWQGREGTAEALADWRQVAVLCNEADLDPAGGEEEGRGDPVDVAFLVAAKKLGGERKSALEEYPLIDQIAYEPERQFAATCHRAVDGRTLVAVKGAPERVLAMCELSEGRKEELTAEAEAMAAKGFRVLALAKATGPGVACFDGRGGEPEGLGFVGYAGMIDPLRPGAREAVADCLGAGVRVCMVTGDHRITARAIAEELGLSVSDVKVVTGEELARADAEWLREAIGRVTVFARVAPHQKLRIVEAARAAGHFVAVTGDGVNDAPALKCAHIGVAMGQAGTDVAREASELVISDDNFSTIVAGVEEGRVAFDNIRNVIYLLISTGGAEIVLVALAVIYGTPLPLLPVQLLWLNLITQGIQDVALAFEPGGEGVLKRRPRPPTQPIFDRLMIERTVIAALVMGGVGFGVFRHLLPEGYTEAELASAQNLLLLLMVLFENVHIGNCRNETRSAFVLSPLRSPILLAGVAGAFLTHLGAMYWEPMQGLLGTAPVGIDTWVWLLGLSLTVFVAMELHKLAWWLRHRGKAESE